MPITRNPIRGPRPRARGRSLAFLVALALVAGLVAGCASSRSISAEDELGQMEHARDLFARGKFGDVLVVLQDLQAARPGNRFADEAMYLMGRSFYEVARYYEAEENFRRVLRDFPESPFSSDCSYHLALALLSQSRGAQLDQTETLAALTQFNSFLSRYPDDELADRAREHVFNIRTKLAEKAYRNGKLYTKLKSHQAARFYFEERVLGEYADTRYGPLAAVAMAESLAKTGRWQEAAEWSRRYLEEYPDGEDADKMRKLEEKAIRKYPGAAVGVLEMSDEAAAADADSTAGEPRGP